MINLSKKLRNFDNKKLYRKLISSFWSKAAVLTILVLAYKAEAKTVQAGLCTALEPEIASQSDCFPSVSAALAQTSAGDTLIVKGVHQEDLRLKSGVLIQGTFEVPNGPLSGAGNRLTLNSELRGMVTVPNGVKATVKYLNIRGDNKAVVVDGEVTFMNSDISASKVAVQIRKKGRANIVSTDVGQSPKCILLKGHLTMVKSMISSCSKFGLLARGNIKLLQMTDSVVLSNRDGIKIVKSRERNKILSTVTIAKNKNGIVLVDPRRSKLQQIYVRFLENETDVVKRKVKKK